MMVGASAWQSTYRHAGERRLPGADSYRMIEICVGNSAVFSVEDGGQCSAMPPTGQIDLLKAPARRARRFISTRGAPTRLWPIPLSFVPECIHCGEHLGNGPTDSPALLFTKRTTIAAGARPYRCRLFHVVHHW